MRCAFSTSICRCDNSEQCTATTKIYRIITRTNPWDSRGVAKIDPTLQVCVLSVSESQRATNVASICSSLTLRYRGRVVGRHARWDIKGYHALGPLYSCNICNKEWCASACCFRQVEPNSNNIPSAPLGRTAFLLYSSARDGNHPCALTISPSSRRRSRVWDTTRGSAPATRSPGKKRAAQLLGPGHD